MVAKDNDQRLVVNGDRVRHWLGLVHSQQSEFKNCSLQLV